MAQPATTDNGATTPLPYADRPDRRDFMFGPFLMSFRSFLPVFMTAPVLRASCPIY